jgi:hypothetical protein
MDWSTRKYLKDNIYFLELKYIVENFTLDASFVRKYILNINYQLTKEEESIDIEYVLKHQPHLNEINDTCLFIIDDDNESIDDFQTISEQ